MVRQYRPARSDPRRRPTLQKPACLDGQKPRRIEQHSHRSAKKLLEKYDDIINEMHSIAAVEAFAYGFKLGMQLLIEIGT